jgi:hypothetical protein
MSVECRSIPNASGKYDSSPEETHKQERTRRKTKKEYTAINQGRWNSACGCRSGCGSRSRLELLWGRCGRAGVALFDVLLLDLGSGRHRPTSETTAHFMFPKMSRRDGGEKTETTDQTGSGTRCQMFRGISLQLPTAWNTNRPQIKMALHIYTPTWIYAGNNYQLGCPDGGHNFRPEPRKIYNLSVF